MRDLRLCLFSGGLKVVLTMWNHRTHESVPKLLWLTKLSSEVCCSMADTCKYSIAGRSSFVDIKLGHPNYLMQEMASNLVSSKEGVDCEGDTVHLNSIICTNTLILEDRALLVAE